MSSEQLERQAVQYIEKGLRFSVRGLANLVSMLAKKSVAHFTAYEIGRQSLESLMNKPYYLENITFKDLGKDILDSEIDIRKFQMLMEQEKFPLAFAWHEDTLYFYTKDKSVMDTHMGKLLERLAKNPDLFKEMKKDKDLNQEIVEAKAQVRTEAVASVDTKEMVR